MFAGRNIDRHKEDIQKRIQELSSKLKQPQPNRPHDRYQPYPQNQWDPPEPKWNHPEAQNPHNHQFDEPPEITKIRNALKQRTIKQNNHQEKPLKYYEQQNERYQQKRKKQESVKVQEDPNIYNMMSEILKNQRNLENQIHMLRSEWNNHKGNGDAPVEVSRDHENLNKTFEVHAYQPIPNQRKSLRTSEKKRDNPKQAKHDFMNQRKPQQNVTHKSPYKPKTTKKHRNKDVLADIVNIVNSQKQRSSRFVADEERKSEFWKAVQQRIKQSEKQYSDSNHRNNRYEHEHLINTHELQSKLKEDLLSKIYGQCNNCIYK